VLEADRSEPDFEGAGASDGQHIQFSIVTYERRPGHWRAAITPVRRAGIIIRGRTVLSFVTPDDFTSKPDAKFTAEQIIIKL